MISDLWLYKFSFPMGSSCRYDIIQREKRTEVRIEMPAVGKAAGIKVW